MPALLPDGCLLDDEGISGEVDIQLVDDDGGEHDSETENGLDFRTLLFESF